MIRLVDFINESLIIKEASEGKTKFQELLSCLFFDACCNKGIIFSDSNDILQYYKKSEKIIKELVSIMGTSKDNFDDIIKSKDWVKSYIYQCNSFMNWLKQHKEFKKPLMFSHHDTSIGILEGDVFDDYNIAERVDKGFKLYGISNKDTYQKADIYAIKPYRDPFKSPKSDSTDELAFWEKGILDGKFVGISLKQIKHDIHYPDTYNFDEVIITVNPSTTQLKCDVFTNAKVNPKLCEFKIGNVSSEIGFDIEICNPKRDAEKFRAIFAIRSNSNGAQSHALKNPKVSYATPVTTELRDSKGAAQWGKCGEWVKSFGDKLPNTINHTSNDFITLINEIKSSFAKYNVQVDINLNPDSIAALDFGGKYNEMIYNLFVNFEQGNVNENNIDNYLKKIGIKRGNKSFEEVMFSLYNFAKWYSITWKMLNTFVCITNIFEKFGGLKEGLEAICYKAKSLKNPSLDAKTIQLPYVMLG